MKNSLALDKIIALAIGFICFTFCSGIHNFFLTAWIWPAALLYVNRSCASLKGFIPVALVVVAGSIVGRWNFYGEGTTLLTIGAATLISLIWIVPLFLDCALHLKCKAWWTALAYPLIMTAVEIVEATSYAGLGSGFSIASSQADCLALVQVCSIIGVSGLALLIYLFGSFLERAIHFRFWRKTGRGRILIGIDCLIIIVLIIFGCVRLGDAASEESVSSIRIATLSPADSRVGDLWDTESDDWSLSWSIEELEHGAQVAVDEGAEIICWGEETFAVEDAAEEEALIERAKELSASSGAMLIVPYYLAASSEDPDYSANKLCMVLPDGQTAYYTKQCLVPFTESFDCVWGDGPFPKVTFKGLVISAAICYDDLFPLIMAGADEDVDLMLVPTYDWDPIWDMHARTVKLRPIENGFTILRANADGISSAFDCKGRQLYSHTTEDYESANMLVVEDVAVTSTHTAFSKICTALDIVLVALGLAALICTIGALIAARKKRASDA